VIRPSEPSDERGILAVVTAAFSDATRDGEEERAIVSGTWAACPSEDRVELVADDRGAVIGHLVAAPGRLDGAPAPVAGVAPVCVAPDWQGQGVGRALMESLVAEAGRRVWAMLVLLGDPAFYGRFGFESAGALGLTYPPAGRGSPHFLALPLRPLESSLRGDFTYCWE
jgi:putative acetyltransferase